MVATKRVPLAEVDNGKERRAAVATTIEAAAGGGSVFQEPLGGFIFVCNNDTMGEDFERHLFGLPQRYQDSVKAIQPGLPLFLYNYSTRCLHGVFEASSDGGLNIEPDAWGENKESRKNGRQSISRFPAQVRVRWREERPPLEEEKFRPVLYHYDGPKFRLQLSKSEAQELLKLFGASPVRKMEELQEDTGGEWEKVKTKSKGGRGYRATLSRGPTSPNSSGGRRRGTAQNSSSSNGGASLSGFNNFIHEAVGRGRERDNKTDSAQRWRNDSDSWSGSSSAGTTSSNSGLHEEDRSKKLPHENGFIADISEGGGLVGGPGIDGINGIASSKGFIHTNGSNVETDQKVEVRFLDEDSNELNGFSVSPVGGANSNARSGFVSYSAALKSGMLASAAAENGFGESLVSAPAEYAESTNNNLGNRNSTNAYSGAASAANVSPSSLNRATKGDHSVDTVDRPNQKVAAGLNKARLHGEVVPSNDAKVGGVFGAENGKHETKVDSLTNGDGSGKRPERAQAWGKPLTAKSTLPEFGSLQSTAMGDKQKAVVKASSDTSTPPKKLVKDALKSVVTEGENGETSVGNSRHGQSEARDSALKPADSVVRKNAWQGNEGAVLRLLHDPDPAVSSSSVSGGTTVKGLEVEAPKTQEIDQKPPLLSQEVVVKSPVEKGDSDGRQSPFPKQFPSTSGAMLPHGSHSKSLQVDGPLFQPGRIVHESRRQQFDNQKHEKHQEERPHYRKQQGHPQEHLQHPPPMLHTPHQLGQGLVPLQIPTASPGGMQQHHHHPILSPSPQPLYRDRSRSRAANGNVENVHGLAYRPISRNMLDGGVALQSPLVSGSWGLQSPMLLMQPMPVTGFTFPAPSSQMLGNAEALHAEILEFARAATPSAETRVHAEAAVECVRSSVKQLWPEADVEVFGSFATGLCLHHSDVDVVVVDAPPPDEVLANPAYSGARLLTPLIRALAAALKENEWCEGLNTIETASMPVIKLRCSPMAEGAPASPPVAIDITIGGKRSERFAGVSQVRVVKEGASKPVNPRFEAARSAHNGAAAREFVIERLRQLPALAPLVLLLKAFLRCRSLNDVYSGGLGSFALTLMLVFYLERAPISCGTPQEIPRSSKSPSLASGEAPSQANGETPPASGETRAAPDASQASEETPPASGESHSLESGETSMANGVSPSPVKGKTPSVANGLSPSPQKGKTASPAHGVGPPPVKGETSPANGETSALSVDISQTSTATAELMDLSDDDSSASSLLTSASASSMASMDITSLHGISGGTEIVTAPKSSSNDEPLLRKAGSIVEELLASMHSVSSPNLGTLLIGFLHFFGQEIDFSRVRLVLKGKNGNPGGLFWHEKNARTLPLWIDDPLRPDANIGAGSFNIWQVQASMREMLSVIVRPQSVGSNPLVDGERVGKGPGRRRHSSLLQPFLVNDMNP